MTDSDARLDSQYATLPRGTQGVDHAYGERVHILSHPYPMALLARLGAPDTHQPAANALLRRLTDWLAAAAFDALLPCSVTATPTRMQSVHPEHGVLHASLPVRDQKVVVVDVARGGILPAGQVYETLNWILDPAGVRQDHVVGSRTTREDGHVDGVELSSAKIGGGIENAIMFVPDPMGATGSSLAGVLDHYKQHVPGTPKAWVLLHVIITPEYIRMMQRRHPDTHIFAVRLDRGLSPTEALAALPGAHAGEKGLNDNDYIVPGAGGLGEVLNNAWI